jgi:hypothetical protein
MARGSVSVGLVAGVFGAFRHAFGGFVRPVADSEDG